MPTIYLSRRVNGVHDQVKSVKPIYTTRKLTRKGEINEDSLYLAIPEGWLPCRARECLVVLEDRQGNGTGQVGMTRFRNWAKYFPSYVIRVAPGRP